MVQQGVRYCFSLLGRNVLPTVLILAVALTVHGLCIPLIHAQSVVTGDLAVTLTDPSGALVPDATITLKSMTEGTIVTTRTNETGGFRFVLLKPGDYKLTVSQKGFKSISQSVQVALGQVTTANVKLEPGPLRLFRRRTQTSLQPCRARWWT